MPKARSVYVCQECGGQYPSSYGRCPGCGAWQSIVETLEKHRSPSTALPAGASTAPVRLGEVENIEYRRLKLQSQEFNRVLGGGVVPGSLVLLGGDPGIGKSTLLLQVSNLLAAQASVLYVTGEESPEQIKLRADRLGSVAPELYILAETDVDAVIEHASGLQPAVLIIDSIQTMQTGDLESPSGTVGQVREATARLAKLAKSQGVAVFLIGHVTKEGNLAGPKTLEHMVDAVLYLEGDRYHAFRLLRSVKNRFGPTNEVGVFDMRHEGLVEVPDASSAFLAERESQASGSVVAVTLEGSRPLLIELQALVTPTHFGLPRRTADGIDMNRLVLLTAVLSKRAGLPLATQDVYVNVVGGMHVSEPASDLATTVAMASGLADTPVGNMAVMGEVGLGGEVRSISQIRRRVEEAQKLGFEKCLVPKRNLRDLSGSLLRQVVGVDTVREALEVSGCKAS